MTLRISAALLLAAGIGVSAAVKSEPGATGGNASTTPVAPPYEDRLIDGGTLVPDRFGGGAAPDYDPQGWPRYWRIEGVASYFDQQGQITRENGARFSAALDTPQYGALSIDATARARPGSFIGSVVQRGLAFDNNWWANNALGVVTTLGIDLARSQYRFFVPTFAALGGTTEWIHDGDVQLQASAGEPGNFDGLRLSGFQSLHGSLATVGAQWAFAPRWQAGVQLIDTRGVDSPYATNGSRSIDSRAAFAALAWNGASSRLQLNFVSSEASDSLGSVNAQGLWLDGRTVWASMTHNYGIFRMEPGLTWGYQPINNDIEGVYYRGNYQSLRWQADGGIDRITSVSGRGADSTYLTLNGRYQLSSRTGVGGNGGYLRNGDQDAWTASLYGDLNGSMGSSRLQVSIARNDNTPANRAEQIALDHTWNVPVGTRLSTSLTATRDTTGGAADTSTGTPIPGSTLRRLGVGLLGGGDITNNVSLDANLQYNVLSRGGTASGVYGSANLNWRLSSNWSVSATYYDNRDDTAKLFVLDPLISALNPLPIQRTRAVYLTLRYEDRAGTAVAPLGGRPGSAAGAIGGYVFLDTNDNGRRDAGEPGAANVTVLLDRRFSVRTDDAGRFEFPFVAAGAHTISVLPDNLPLPWVVEGDRREISVSARESALVEIAARRLR
jgi:SdrD B-like domain